MAGLFLDPELETRKRVLVAECEIYRQTLKLEMHNLGLYGTAMRRKLSIFRWVQPAVAVIGPLSALWLNSRRVRAEKNSGVFSKLLLGWRLYRKYGHLLANLLPSGKAGAASRKADLFSSSGRV